MNDSTSAKESRLEVRDIYKSFGVNKVLKGINLRVDKGEILALIGGNGAGKSTLMKILMGIYLPDSGEIYLDGEHIKIQNPAISLAKGIYLVPQEPLLFPNMTVSENIIISMNGKKDALLGKLKGIMEEIGWKIDLERKAETLSIAEQQLVEILRGLMRDSKLLILDEPTSSLTFHEVKSLFKTVLDLKSKGISIIYITHRLSEVFEISDSIVIMRDGIITVKGPVSEFTHEMLLQGLLPPNVDTIHRHAEESECLANYNKVVLDVKDFSGYGFKNISLKVHEGEILGLAGVVGAGRTELATTIFGRDKVLGGKVSLNGENITGLSTAELLAKGVAYLAEDRFQNGIFGLSDIEKNTTASSLNRFGKCFMSKKKEQEETQKYIDLFRTKVVDSSQQMSSLSGGNQQKVVIARALAANPKLLILDEPTRGIDIIARADVYSIIKKLKENGLAILLISSDMEEIIELSDRAMTMYCGTINKEFTKENINHDNLTTASFGIVSEGV